MDESYVFGKLAARLTPAERKTFLEKLSHYSSFSQEALYEEQNDVVSTKIHQAAYSQLPWYIRLFFVFMSFFQGTSPIRFFENRRIALIGKRINETAPGIYDYQQDFLLPALYKKLVKLKDAARFFYKVLDQSINRDKGAFYAFLGSLEMEDIHNRLNKGTDPEILTAENPQASEAELRQMAADNMEKSLGLITEQQKNTMYADTRSLHCLKALSTFLFDRLILNFSDHKAFKGPVCTAGMVKDQLIILQNVLFSLKYAPSMALLESLFIFTLQGQMKDKKADVTVETDRLLAQAEKSLDIIHDFNQEVPLTQILRCASRDMTISPLDISGGEDWFLVYRDHWKRYAEERFTQHIHFTGRQKLIDSITQFFKRTSLKMVNHVASDTNSQGFPVKGTLCLSFLLTFYSSVFVEKANEFLESILLGGNFYSREDRTVFTESYNELMKLEEIIKHFEMQVSPVGEFGKRFAAAQADRTVSSLRRHKLLSVTDEANQEVFRIVRNAGAALEGIINMLGRIVKTTPAGESNVLMNMTQLTGKGNVFITSLNDFLVQLQESLKFFNDIIALELGK
ncbi:MAG: DUF5312 domain-containing protein [Spirochaetaceae bacterium]|jgi:hypothetical protein|nr:DUF5312 domain-containing protein [Spirochaetaceae bacterium]